MFFIRVNSIEIIKNKIRSCYMWTTINCSLIIKNLLTQVSSSNAATTLVVKNANYIWRKQNKYSIRLNLYRTQFPITRHGHHTKKAIKSQASKTPYMVVDTIRALHFNRDLNQVCVQTPSEIKNRMITYFQIKSL